MNVVEVYPLYKRRALVTRESAGVLRDAIFAANGPVALDLGRHHGNHACVHRPDAAHRRGEPWGKLGPARRAVAESTPGNGQQAPTNRPCASCERGRGREGQLDYSRAILISLDEVRCPLRHRNYREVEIGPDRVRHDRGVDDAQSVDAVDLPVLVHHGQRVI